MNILLTEKEEILEKLEPGFKFTSNWFDGIIEIVSIDKEKIIPSGKGVINVTITSIHGGKTTEEWNLDHTIVGFKNLDYWPLIKR